MSGSPRAVFPDCTAELEGLLTPELRALVPELVVRGAEPSPDALVACLRDYPACVLFSRYVSREVMAGCPGLRSIVYLSTGVASHVDMEAAAARGIRVRNVAGYADRAIAEHVLALVLTAARRIGEMDRALRRGQWLPQAGTEVQGRTLGVIGLGATGRATAALAHAVGMRVIAFSRGGVPEGLPCRPAALDDLLRDCDFVSLHLAHTAETDRLIDRRRLALMKPGAVLINTARGHLVDEDALVECLRSGRLGHAALDVFHDEPLRADHPVTTLPNVTLTAHAAWNTDASGVRLLRRGFEALKEELRRIAGEP